MWGFESGDVLHLGWEFAAAFLDLRGDFENGTVFHLGWACENGDALHSGWAFDSGGVFFPIQLLPSNKHIKHPGDMLSASGSGRAV